MTRKVQLLTEEQTKVKHEFWEDSPSRIAMQNTLKTVKQIPGARFYFVGERNNGLWIVFLDDSATNKFLDIMEL